MNERDRHFLEIAAELFHERGYEGLTVEEVAVRARASKATIYRRWPTKAALVAAAIETRVSSAAFTDPPEGLELRDALLHHVRALAAEAVELRDTVASLIGEVDRHPELYETLAARFVDVRRDAMLRLLPDVADAPLIGSLAASVIYFRLLIERTPVDEHLPETLVDRVMLPLLPESG